MLWNFEDTMSLYLFLNDLHMCFCIVYRLNHAPPFFPGIIIGVVVSIGLLCACIITVAIIW